MRTVNHRYFKAVIKLPEKLNALESDIDKLLRESVARGSVVYALSVKDLRGVASLAVNQPVLDRIVRGADSKSAKIVAANGGDDGGSGEFVCVAGGGGHGR